MKTVFCFLMLLVLSDAAASLSTAGEPLDLKNGRQLHQQAQSGRQLAPQEQESLSDRMTWEQIGRALEAFPPSFDQGDPRLLIMQSMDRLVNIQVQYMKPEDERRLREIVDFYRRRVDRGLEALQQAQIKEGVGVFKFYSSSLVLKSAQGTVAIDFCQGPVHNAGEPESCDLYRAGFYLTPGQRDRLARLIDVQLITHRHHDHADYSLAKRLIERGRPVVGPAQLKTHWADLAGGITVPAYDTVQTLGPCQVLTQLGYQYATSKLGPDGKRHGVPDPASPGRDSESVRYLVRVAGIVFLQSAENQVEADRWLAKAADRGWNVDVLLSPGQYQGGESVMKFLQGNNYFRIPLHEYEMQHEGGGNRTGNYLAGASRKAFDAKRFMPLLWGEHFRLRVERRFPLKYNVESESPAHAKETLPCPPMPRLAADNSWDHLPRPWRGCWPAACKRGTPRRGRCAPGPPPAILPCRWGQPTAA